MPKVEPRAPYHLNPPAPKHLRLRKGLVGTTLPPGALAIVDSLVGTYLGSSRSEVMRFIALSWITDHHLQLKTLAEQVKRS